MQSCLLSKPAEDGLTGVAKQVWPNQSDQVEEARLVVLEQLSWSLLHVIVWKNYVLTMLWFELSWLPAPATKWWSKLCVLIETLFSFFVLFFNLSLQILFEPRARFLCSGMLTFCQSGKLKMFWALMYSGNVSHGWPINRTKSKSYCSVLLSQRSCYNLYLCNLSLQHSSEPSVTPSNQPVDSSVWLFAITFFLQIFRLAKVTVRLQQLA